jgi:hypothetical protein
MIKIVYYELNQQEGRRMEIKVRLSEMLTYYIIFSLAWNSFVLLLFRILKRWHIYLANAKTKWKALPRFSEIEAREIGEKKLILLFIDRKLIKCKSKLHVDESPSRIIHTTQLGPQP